MVAFGGRFWGLFKVVFGCFWSVFSVNLELFFGQSLRTTFIVSEQLPLWLCSLSVLLKVHACLQAAAEGMFLFLFGPSRQATSPFRATTYLI